MVKHRQTWGLVGVGNNPRTPFPDLESNQKFTTTCKYTSNPEDHTGFTKLITNAKFDLTR
jgi:hypothetical protein